MSSLLREMMSKTCVFGHFLEGVASEKWFGHFRLSDQLQIFRKYL